MKPVMVSYRTECPGISLYQPILQEQLHKTRHASLMIGCNPKQIMLCVSRTISEHNTTRSFLFNKRPDAMIKTYSLILSAVRAKPNEVITALQTANMSPGEGMLHPLT